jgi:diaminopimelate epimerase
MRITFSKYQGTGNDFIMLDNMSGQYDDLTTDEVQYLCNRKTGIGADGLIKLSTDSKHQFFVDYFNADGSKSFCGNGARCSVAFARHIGLIQQEAVFRAIDGVHHASIEIDGRVHLEMLPVSNIQSEGNIFVLNTGSPHYVAFFTPETVPEIVPFGKEIRYSETYMNEGINVNTVLELGDSTIHVATYERGVEDETLSCGTGVTACALAYMIRKNQDGFVSVTTKGGKLAVKATRVKTGFEKIWLVGPAKRVFDGNLEL